MSKQLVSPWLLQVDNLETSFDTEAGTVKVLDGVNFKLKKGQTLGIVGESGCGKSVTAASIMGLLPKPYGRVTAGEIWFKGQDLVQLPKEQLFKMRGNRISMIFQEPMTALNPVQTLGQQLGEVYEIHQPELNRKQRDQASIQMLEKVGMPDAKVRLKVYPHELSGGMRQRVMIAMALACKPDILIADEPTTALDVTIQAQILELMATLQQETGMAIILITHDLGVVAQSCDHVVVMYAGRVVEQGNVYDLFDYPSHPYTQGLMSAIPRLDSPPKQKLTTIEGTVPALDELPLGCRFSNRCPYHKPACNEATPAPRWVGQGHSANCINIKEIDVIATA